MQSLNEKLASLSRFVSKGIEKQLPFFRILKGCLGKKKIVWNEEAERAFVEMKEYIAKLPTLTSLEEGETLFIYFAASKECISTVLVTERERTQVPIYFVSRVLQGAELNYPELEKLTLALVHTARKLRRYFQAHQIVVLTNKPIRHAIKGQVLADFIAERDSVNEEDTKNSTQVITPKIENEEWKLYTDGTSSSDGSGAGLMLVNPKGKEFTYALHFKFATTNNEAEYEALLAGLRMAKELKILHLRAFVDSQLVSNQIKGTFEAKQPTIQQSQNKKADALSKLASLTFEHLAKEVLVEVLEKKLILAEEVNDLIQEDEVTWMTPLQVYLETGKLPEDKNEARKIRIKAPSYKMMNGALYRRSFLTPWLRCVGPKQATVIIQEMHEGICGLHAGPRLPKQELISVTSAWPFVKWGIDIVGPINDTPGSPRFLLVAIDYFTKWAEAKPLAAITEGIFPKFCKQLKIQQNFTLAYHPQGNGQVEVTNRDIIKGIEKRLGKCKKGWVDELPLVLWAHKTTPKRSNGETPYSLAYGTEAVLPAEIQVLTERTGNNKNNEENLRVNLDLLEERREAAVIREASYKRAIEGYYNKRVKPSTFKVEEYVLRLNSA
ncbi:uncharacterized protein [Rutidosis leptorrhynchoides]|uniref:uncharacterized protein n=1 Tax=Rutidosis leptorrhynchoides TaxID=125765 RepID=UPI003A98F3CD